MTQSGWTPLITAADSGNCDIVIELLSLGCNANVQSNVSIITTIPYCMDYNVIVNYIIIMSL